MKTNAMSALGRLLLLAFSLTWLHVLGQGDGGVLCDFYNGVTNKAPLANWCVGSAPYSPCSTGSGAWVGVTCENVGGVQRVTSLSLFGPGPGCAGPIASLSGASLPASIGNLGALTLLQLCGLSLEGSLPSSLWTLTGLQLLGLGLNKFDGTLSDSVGQLTGLTSFNVESNTFRSTLPSSLGQLTKLNNFWLGKNSFSGALPSSFCSLSHSMNLLAIQASPSLACLPSCLTKTNYPNLIKDAPLTAVCDTAQGDGGVLCDFYNGVTNKAPLANWCVGSAPYDPCSTGSGAWVGVTCGNVGGVQRVTKLSLAGPSCGGSMASLGGGSVPASVGGVAALTILSLCGVSLGGSLPSSLWTLTGLQRLDLGSNKLEGTISSSIGGLTGLTLLILWSNSLGGSLPSTLWTLPRLQHLDLPENKLTGTLSSSLGGLTGLTFLSVQINSLGGSLPSSLGQLTRLQTLYLDQNKFTAFVPASFCSLPRSMSQLYINSNPGLTCIPSCLTTANYPNLIKDASLTAVCDTAQGDGGVLCDFYNGVTNKAPLANWCVGSAPYSPCSTGSGAWVGVTCGTVGGVQRVTSLLLYGGTCAAGNGGSNIASLGGGSVPASIGGLGALTRLHLCGLGLGGSMPSSLWTLTRLQDLALAWSKFTGTLSSSVGGLTGLTWLSFSENSLVGSLPSSLEQLTSLKILGLDANGFTGAIPASFCSLPHGINPFYIGETPSLTCAPSCLTTAYFPGLNGAPPATVCPPAALPVSYYPSTSFPSGFTLERGNLVGVIALPSQYTVSFDLMPTADDSVWRSIIRLTASTASVTDMGAGARLPGVFFCGTGTCPTLGIQVSIIDAALGNHIIQTDALQLNAWSTVIVAVDSIKNFMSVSASSSSGSVDIPTQSISLPTPSQQTWPNVQVFASDTWYTVASAKIRNLYIAPVSTLPVSYFPSSSYPSGFTLVQSNLLGLIILPAQYSLSFDLMPTADGSGWRDIIHLSATGGDLNGPGSRIPTAWFCDNVSCPSLGLYVIYIGSGAGNVNERVLKTSQALPLNQWSTVTITVDTVNLIMSLTVYGAITIPTQSVTFPQPAQQTWLSVQVWASNPWQNLAAARIRNLAIAPPAALPVSYYPSTSYPSGFTLERGNLVGVVSLPTAYTVSFDLMPAADCPGCTFRNIVHLSGSGSDQTGVGPRLPGVWFCLYEITDCPVLGLWVAYIGTGTSKENVIPTSALPLNQWSTVSISIDSSSLAMALTVSGGLSMPTKGVPLIAQSQSTWPSVQVYASDPWYSAPAANIRNLAISVPPSVAPTVSPSAAPTAKPSLHPSTLPTVLPSASPSLGPTALPTFPFPTPDPTARPTAPTPEPTPKPSAEPTMKPSPQPSAKPSARPTPQPSTHPTTRPSPSPSTRPSPQPSPQPTPQPSAVPTTKPTPRPSPQPTEQPSAQPTPKPTHAPTGQPSSRPSSRPTSKPTRHCGPGTYIGNHGLECLSCPRGTFSDVFGAMSCTPCKPGSFSSAGRAKCTLCPKTSYQPESGAGKCIVCPAGRLTSFDGSTSESACLSPLNNFILGSVALGFAALLVCLYVIYGRFRFTSFIRRERVVMQQVKEYKMVMYELMSFEDDVRYELGEAKVVKTIDKIYDNKKSSTLFLAVKDIAGILFFTFLCVTVGTFAVVLCFAFIMMRIFFNALIIWKQSNNFLPLVDYRSAIVQVADALSELFADWHFPPIVVQMVRTLLWSLELLFDLLARFKIDLSAMNVTCQGSKDPFILLENLFVLGCVIIVIESQMQVFRGLVFTTTLEKHNSILLSREYRLFMLSREKKNATSFDRAKWFASYALELLQLLVLQVLAQIFDFKTVLQFAVAQVEFSAFVSSPTHTMASTEACNQVPGAVNFDYLLATVTSGLAFAVVLPTIYEVAKVCCPNDPVAMRTAARKREAKMLQEQVEGRLVVSKQKSQSTRLRPLNFWSYLRMPLTLLAPDLLLAHYTNGLVWLLLHSVSANLDSVKGEERDEKLTRRQSLAVGHRHTSRALVTAPVLLTVSTSNPMLAGPGRGPADNRQPSFASRLDSSQPETNFELFLAGLRRFFSYMVRTLHPFREDSPEADRWREMTETNCLPSYWDLLRDEAEALFGTKSALAACFLAVIPVGHLSTAPGRRALIDVMHRFRFFVSALLGRWTKDAVDAFDIFGQVERMAVDKTEGESEDRNRINKRYSEVIEATIAPRAILLQLVPWLTIWSIFSIATASSAMWVRGDSGLLGKKHERKRARVAERPEAKEEKSGEGSAQVAHIEAGSDENQLPPPVQEQQQEQQEQEAKEVKEAKEEAIESAPASAQEADEEATEDEEAKVFPWFISFKDGYRRALNESNGRWRKHRWITFIAALRIVILHSRAITYLFSVFMTFISVYLLFQPTNKAVLASIVIVLLPLAIVQGLGVVLIVGKSLNVKDLFDVGNPGDTEKTALELKEQGKSKDEVKAFMLATLKKKKRKLFPCVFDDDYEYDHDAGADDDGNKPMTRGGQQLQQRDLSMEFEGDHHVEMAMTKHRPHHHTVAEIILRDSIGPEMPPSMPFRGDGGRPSLPRASHHVLQTQGHVLQAHGHLHILHQHGQQQGHQPPPAIARETRRIHIHRPAASLQGDQHGPPAFPPRMHTLHVPVHLEATPIPTAPQGSLLQSLSRLPVVVPEQPKGMGPQRRIKLMAPLPESEDNNL